MLQPLLDRDQQKEALAEGKTCLPLTAWSACGTPASHCMLAASRSRCEGQPACTQSCSCLHLPLLFRTQEISLSWVTTALET